MIRNPTARASAWLRNPRRYVAGTMLAAALLGVASSHVEGQQKTVKRFTNPIIDQDFPDPSVLRVGDTWYAYGTGQLDGDPSHRFIPMSMSRDLVHWSVPRTVLEKPAWASGAFWAPEVIRDPARPHRYVMYFSAKSIPGYPSVPPGSKLCLGVAVSDKPDGVFTPVDHPLDKDACKDGDGDIDPNVFLDDKPGGTGNRYLYWGSAHKPIRRQVISDDLLSLVPGTKEMDIVTPTTTPAGQRHKYTDLVEGTYVIYRDGRYYMFTSGFFCCSRDDDAYAVVVWRSDSARGPWTRFPGGVDGSILHSNGIWGSPGHNGIFVDGAGHDWMIYHARHRGKAGRVLMMNRLIWENGWPHLETDTPDSPSIGPMPAPIP